MYCRGTTYYLLDFRGSYHGLGSELGPALTEYARIMGAAMTVNRTFGEALESYLVHELPKRSESYRRDQTRLSKYVILGLGEISLDEITAIAINAYLTYRENQSTPAAVQKERALIGATMKYACKNAWAPHNPMSNVPSRCGRKKRKHELDVEDLRAFATYAPLPIRRYLQAKLVTGARRADILKMMRHQFKEDGIHLTPSKTAETSGASIIIEWTPRSRAIMNDLWKYWRHLYLITNRKGTPYTYDGFQSQWQKWMRKAHAKGVIKKRFTDTDIRAFVANGLELDDARKLLGHSDTRTTKAHYRQDAERVKSPV